MKRALLPAVAILVVCAVSDLASIPPLLSASGTNAPPTAVAWLVGALGLATIGVAAALRTGSRASWRAAVAIRVVDGVAAALGLAASDGTVKAAAATTLVLSVVALVVLARSRADVAVPSDRGSTVMGEVQAAVAHRSIRD